MNVTGTASLSTYPAVVCATTAEESLRLAMGESYVPMPDALVGTTKLNGELNAKTVHVAEVAEIEPVAEVDSEMIPVVDSVIVEDVTSETGELNEVIGFSSDDSGNWAWVRDESGTLFLVSEDEWSVWYGEAGEIELMNAVDAAWLASMRSNLVAA